MNYEKSARKITAKAIELMLKEREHRFSVAYMALAAINEIIQAMIMDEAFSGYNDALALQRELLEQIDKACE